MRPERLTVKRKLIFSFGSLAALVLVVSATSLKALDDANSRFRLFIDGIDSRTKTATAVRDAVDRRAIAVRNMVLVTKAPDFMVEKNAANEAHSNVQSRLEQLRKILRSSNAAFTSGHDQMLVSSIEEVERVYGPVALAIVDLAASGRQREAIAKMNDECRPLLERLEKAVQAYVEYNDSRARAMISQAVASYAKQNIALIAACVAAFLTAALAGWWLAYSLRRALGAEPSVLGTIAQQVASGDLSPVDGASKAIPGSVLDSLASMQQELAALVGQVRGSANSIATGSVEIASGSASIALRTEEQAGSLVQTAATLEQVTNAVNACAQAASMASHMAASASQVAIRGGDVVNQVVITMVDIQDSSRRISEIIGTIDGIAFQTNLLALNAAVEAAHAGNQGKGFAVVATEVRNLAQRSAVAAREIKSLIVASVERVEAGGRLVEEAGLTMEDILKNVRHVATTISEISTMARKQSHDLGQVNMAMSALEIMTNQNAAMVEESSAAASSLRDQAHQLSDLVGAFRLNEISPHSHRTFSIRSTDQSLVVQPQIASIAPSALKIAGI
ncbi:MAG: methyl-accepting chemotaxis protein [Burkholderiales bacterium]